MTFPDYLSKQTVVMVPVMDVEPVLVKPPPVPEHLLTYYLQQLAPSSQPCEANCAKQYSSEQGGHSSPLCSLTDILRLAHQAPGLSKVILGYHEDTFIA